MVETLAEAKDKDEENEVEKLRLNLERVMKFLDAAEGRHAVVDGLPASTLDLEDILNASFNKGWDMLQILQNPAGTYWKMIFRRRRV